MESPFPNWITRQMIRGARGFNLDAYLMALEGWRRGLTLTWYLDPSEVTDLKIIGFNPLGKSFSLQNNETGKIHYFYRSRGDLVANEAVDLVHDKFKAKQLLLDAGVSTPKGFKFYKEDTVEEIIARFNDEDLDYPVVVKPIFGSLGKGVITNIKNEAELHEALEETKVNEEYDQFIVEQHIEGTEYRVYVVGNEVAAATKRVPAHVVGDGKSTIKQLIDEKNEQRKENPYLRNKLMEIDEDLHKFISKQGLTLASIPDQNQKIRVKNKGNITAGGEPVDVMEIIPKEVRNLAIEAVKAMPGLNHCGIDIIVNNNEPYIIEMNATAGISIHLFPVEGAPRNVPETIIDYYFPETKGLTKGKEKLYFNYRDVRLLLRDKLAQEFTLRNVPQGELYTARYIVSGKVQKVNYRHWIRRQAVRKGLHGYTRNLQNGDVAIVVGGDKEEVKNFKDVCAKGPRRAEVRKTRPLMWNGPIRLGFEIRKTR